MIKAPWCFLTKCQLCLVIVSQQTRCIFNDRYCCFFYSLCLTRKSQFSFCVFLSYRSSRRLPQQCDLRISDPSAGAAELPPAGRWTLPGRVVHPVPDTGMLGGPLLCLEDCEPLPTLCPDRYLPQQPPPWKAAGHFVLDFCHLSKGPLPGAGAHLGLISVSLGRRGLSSPNKDLTSNN